MVFCANEEMNGENIRALKERANRNVKILGFIDQISFFVIEVTFYKKCDSFINEKISMVYTPVLHHYNGVEEDIQFLLHDKKQ